MSMFGWLAAIGAGIGAVAFDLGTSAGAAVAGTMYGEHKIRNQIKKKVNKFAKQLEKRLDNLNAKLKNISDGLNGEFDRQRSMNENINENTGIQKSNNDIKDIANNNNNRANTQNNNHINEDAKDNDNNNNLAKTQTYGNNKYKKLDGKIEDEKNEILKDLYDLLLTEWDKKRLDEAKEIIKNIKNNINKGNPLTLEDVKQLYGIFTKKSWMAEKFSPNIIRQNDLLIKMLMNDIIAPLKEEQKDTDCKNNININNKENNIINDDAEKNNLLNAIFTQIFSDKNTNTEMKKYRVFFDFLARYSGYGDTIKDKSKWNYNDCMLVEEFIKDKEFEMYEDIEELPECCKKIAEIEQMFQDNLVDNNDKQKIEKRIWPILDTKLNSLSEQLKKIQKKDEKVKKASLKEQLKKIKIKETKDDNVSKAINDFIEKQEQQPNKYQSLLNKAKKIIEVMNNNSANICLDKANKGKEDGKGTVIKNV